MDDKSAQQEDKNAQQDDLKKIKEDLQQIHSEQDGRNKEWQDRARVNLEKVPEGTESNIERDFEPEEIHKSKEDKSEHPPY